MSDNDFNAIAGFDTSSIALDSAALQQGLAGIAVANAAFANLSSAARYANGVALIEAAAALAGTSPVRPLLAFAHTLGSLEGNATYPATLGAHIAQLVANGTVPITDAMNDVFSAAYDDQITGFEGMAALLAFADNGTTDVQIRAGMALSGLIRQDTGHGGGSEGGGSEGEGSEGGGSEGGGQGQTAPVFTFQAMLTALDAARADGTLSPAETINLLVGIAARPNSQYTSETAAELAEIANGDAAATLAIVKVLAVAGGIAASMAYPGDESGYTYMVAQAIRSVAAPGGTALVSFQNVVTAIHDAVDAGTLSGLPAVLLVGQYANATGVLTANLDMVIAEALDYMSDGALSASAAVAALTTVSLSVGTFATARMLATLAGIEHDLAQAAGARLATLIDTTSPSFAVPNWKMTAQQAVQGIAAAVSADPALASAAVGLLAWMSTVPGGVSQDRHAMNAASDGVRGLVEGGAISAGDAAAAVIAAIEPDALTLAQGMGFLLAVSASGSQQIQGNVIVWVANPALAAAVAAALADLIVDRNVAPADIGAALDALFPNGVTGVTGADDPSLVLATLMAAAATLSGTQADALADMGRALALSLQVPGSLVMSGVSNALQGGTFTASQALDVVLGFAGSGNAGDLVAAGRELTFILNQHTLTPADGVAQVAAAVSAGDLSVDAALLLLMGAATGTPPVGTAQILAQIATYLDAGAATGVAVFDSAVRAALLDAEPVVSVLFQAAALGAPASAEAARGVILDFVADGIIGATAAANLVLASAEDASAPLAGTLMAALVAQGSLAAAAVIALLDAAVPASLAADTAVSILVHFAAADVANLAAGAQAEIDALIASGAITLQAVIAELQGLQAGASAALQDVIDAQLAVLITDPATLALTAGLGSAVQVAAAASAIAALFTSNAPDAQAILDALEGRIEGGNLTPERAASLLAQIYARGGDATAPVLATMAALTSAAHGRDIGVGTLAEAIATQLEAGTLSKAQAFVAFGTLAPSDASTMHAFLGGLLLGSAITPADLEAAVDAGSYSPGGAIVALMQIIQERPAQASAALATIVSLVGSDASVATVALQEFYRLTEAVDHGQRLLAYEGIGALAEAFPGEGLAAFERLLVVTTSIDTGIRTDALAGLSALLERGALTAAEAIQTIADQLSLSNPSPALNATQALSLLVALSGVEDARDAIYAYMGQVAAANAAAAANGNPVWGFLPATAITALANGAGADDARVVDVSVKIVSLAAGYLNTAGIIQSLLGAGTLPVDDLVTLMSAVAGRLNDAGAPAQFGASIAGQISGLSLADQIASLDGLSLLVGSPPEQVNAPNMVALLVAVYANGARDAALAELADIGAGTTAPGGVASALTAAIAAGTLTLQLGMDVLAGLATGGAPGFAGAVAQAIETAVNGGAITGTQMADAVHASLNAGLVTVDEAVTLLQDVVLGHFERVGAPGVSNPVTDGLLEAVLNQINTLIADGRLTVADAAAALAGSAAGAASGVLLLLGSELAAFADGPARVAPTLAAVSDAVRDGDIGGAEGIALFVGVALAGGEGHQVAAGAAIAGLAQSGAVSETAATSAIYGAFLDSGLSLGQVVNMVAGAWASGSTMLGAVILDQVESHAFATYDALAGDLVDAVNAGHLTAAQMVAGAAAIVALTGGAADGAAVLSTMMSEGIMDGEGALVALGGSISASGFTPGLAIALVIALADARPGDLASLGVGLAELVAADRLAFSAVTDALSDMLAEATPALTFTQVVTLLVAAAGDPSQAAADAGIAAQVGTHLITLTGADAQALSDVLDVVETAALDASLPPAIAIALLGGFASAGTLEQQLAVGETFEALITANISDFFTIMGTLMAEAQAAHISGAGALVVILSLTPDLSHISYVAGAIDTLVNGAALTPGDAAQSILLAARASVQAVSLEMATALLLEMAQRHVADIDAADAAFVIAAADALADLVAEGDLSATDLLATLSNLPAFGAIPLLAALEGRAEAGGALADGAHAALLDRLPDVPLANAVQSIGPLIGAGGIPPAIGLSLLLDMAGGGVAAQALVGQEIAARIADADIAMSDLRTAIAGRDAAFNAVLLAAVIDAGPTGVPAVVIDELVVLAITSLPGGATSYGPTLAPLIAAIKDAVTSPILLAEPTGLSLPQAVLALAGFSRLGGGEVRADVASAFADLLEEFHQGPGAAIALLSRLAVSSLDDANAAAIQIVYLGDALGLSAADLAQAVADSVDSGLSAQQAITVLAHLTAVNPANWGGPSAVDFYPHLGLAAGAAMADLVGGDLTFAGLVDLLTQFSGVSADNRALLLIGLAGAGSEAEQIAVGRALALVPTAHLYAELAQVPEAVARMVLIGLFLSDGSPVGAIGLDDADVAALLADLDAAVEAGALPAADALAALVTLLSSSTRQGEAMAVLRIAVHGELTQLVPDKISAQNAVRALLVPGDSPTPARSAEAGAMIAALVKAGLIGIEGVSTAIDTALGSTTLTPAQAASLMTGAALYHDFTDTSAPSYALQLALGHKLGGLIEDGAIAVADLQSAIEAAQSAYRMGALQGEVALLAALAAHAAAGLPTAIGEMLAGLYASGQNLESLILPVFDSVIGAPGQLSAQQAQDVLLAMAGAFEGTVSGLFGVQAVAGELLALVGRGALGAAGLADAAAGALASGQGSVPYGLSLLTYLAADGAVAGAVRAELATLLDTGAISVSQAVSGLLFAASTHLTNTIVDTGAVSGINRLLTGLVEDGRIPFEAAIQNVEDAEAAGTLSAANAVGVLAGLAPLAANEAELRTLGTAIGALFAAGMSDADASVNLDYALAAGWASAAQMASLVAYAAGITAALPQAQAFDLRFTTFLAPLAVADTVAAFDRAYDAGGIPAFHVVQILSGIPFGSTPAAVLIGPELLKMALEGGLGLPAVIDQIIGLLPNFSYYSGLLVGAMAVGAPEATQISLGHAMGAAIVDGDISFERMFGGLGRVGLDADAFNTVLLSLAGGGNVDVLVAVGAEYGRPLSTIPVSATAVDADTIAALQAGLAAGALTAAQLAVLLAGMGQVDYPSPYAPHTASAALNGLVVGGSLTAAQAMAAIHNAAASLDFGKLIHWLAGTSTYAALHAAVAEEIADLADAGSAADVLQMIREITGTTPLDVAALTAISQGEAAQLLVSIAGFGDAGTQDAVGAQLAVSVSANSAFLADIDAAVSSGALSGLAAVHVIAHMLGALGTDPAGTVRIWAATQVDAYVDAGRVTSAAAADVLLDAASQATDVGQAGLGAVLGALDVPPSEILDAVQAGDLTPAQAVGLLIGFGYGEDALGTNFLAARAALVTLLDAGEVTGTQILTDATTSALSGEQVNVLLLGLIGHGSAADDLAIGQHFVASAARFGTSVGAADDPFFTGILGEAGLAYGKIRAGQMSVAEAITDLVAYGSEHDVSAYAGLYALNSLLAGDPYAPNAVRAAMIDQIALGHLSEQLANRVSEGTTSAMVSNGSGGFQIEARDPSALTAAQATQILNWEATLAFQPEQAALASYMFADDLWVAQQLRANSISWVNVNTVVEAMLRGVTYLDTGIPGVGRSSYAYDLALVSMLEQLTGDDLRPPAQQDYRIALTALSTRLVNGSAEDTLVKQFAAGNLTFEQVMAALEMEVAATGLGSGGTDQDLMHDMALAWLHLRARQYVSNNFGTSTALDVQQFIQQLNDPAYGDDILTGYGALMGLSSTGAGAVLSVIDKQEAIRGAQWVIASRVPPGMQLSDTDQAVLDAMHTMGGGMAMVLNKTPIGRSYVTVLENPTDAEAYARFGGQVAGMAASRAATEAVFAGTPVGAAMTATKIGAAAALYVLSMGAVQDALGEGPTAYLRGQLTIASATASLIGDTFSDLGAVGADIAIAAAPHFMEFGDALARGDAEGIASSIGELAMDYYMLQTGVDPRLYAAVGERFGDLIVHLFTGDTGALGDDVRALGAAYLDTIIKNPYLAAIGARMVQYAETINGALADINDSYRILGQNIYTGLLYVGTGFDEAGNVLRSVAHKIGGFVGDLLSGLGIDGYISGATVFADANFNGVLDAGEASTFTDANGRYVLAANGAPLILIGGIDTATNLPFRGTLLAPAGSTAITPLTTLIQKVAESGSGDPEAAQRAVAAALGLSAGLDLNDLDTIAATRRGELGAAEAFATAASLLNTVSLLSAAGASDDPFDAIAARLAAAAAAGEVLNLSDTATLAALASGAGVSDATLEAVVALASASNSLIGSVVARGGDPMSLLEAVTAVSISAQGSTAQALAAAGSDPAALAAVLAGHTGTALASQVAAGRLLVGGFGDGSAGGGEVPLKISADGHGIELALDGGSPVAGNWVRFSALDLGLQQGSTLLIYAVDEDGNRIDRDDKHAGADVSLSDAMLIALGSVADDHGAGLFFGAHSVYLPAGDQLRFAVLGDDQSVNDAPDVALTTDASGAVQATVGGLHIAAAANNALSDAADLAGAQRSTGLPFVFLQSGETLKVELAGSAANTNTLAFVRVDVDATNGAMSVAGVAYGDTPAFTEAVRNHLDAGFLESRSGDFKAEAAWTVSGATGFYAPVLITPVGNTFVVGTANPGGYEHVRMFGENTFGFEDLAFDQGSDFDYNDMVMRLAPLSLV
ncbi:MAG: hypothetical protein AB1592_09170 [Pseudomonadota bacterium]